MYECSLYDIIKMRDAICLNALYRKLLKLRLAYIWMLCTWYYWNESWYISQCPIYYFVKM